MAGNRFDGRGNEIIILLILNYLEKVLSSKSMSYETGRTMQQKTKTSKGSKKTIESFSSQWSFFKKTDRVWSETVEERKNTFLKEIDSDPKELAGKAVLDAGCGVGTASEAMAEVGLWTVAMDISEGVFETRRRVENVVRGDLLNIPFREGVFDIVYAKGTLHHTPDTNKAFNECAKKLKEGGLFYVWIYRKSGGFKKFLLKYIKPVLRRIPPKLKPFVFAPIALIRMIRERLNFNEAMVTTFDFFSPPFRFEHTEEEVRRWYEGLGFRKIRRTNNVKEGFGLLGEKK